jgi:hypothetical protein
MGPALRLECHLHQPLVGLFQNRLKAFLDDRDIKQRRGLGGALADLIEQRVAVGLGHVVFLMAEQPHRFKRRCRVYIDKHIRASAGKRDHLRQ